MSSPFEKLCKKASRDNPIHFQEAESSSSSSPSVSTDRLHRFNREYNAADDYAQRYTVLRRWWADLGLGEMPDRHQEMLSAQVGYEIQARAFVNAEIVLPSNLMKNLIASRNGDVEGFTPGMKRMLEIGMKTNEKKGGDGIAKKASSKKETVLGVSQFYLEIFENQKTAKLTDSQIQDAIKAKTGAMPTAKNVASYRCMYNAGNLQGQSKFPAEKCKAVRVSKAKPKKPMSKETKAKLKAYTAAKKAKAAKSNKKK